MRSSLRVQIQAASPGFIMLTSDNAFIKDWIEKHYLKDIQKALSDLYNLDFQVLIEVDPTAAAPAPAAQPAPTATPSSPAVAPQAVQPQPKPAATSAQNAPVPAAQSANAGAPQPTHSVAQAEASEPQSQKTETNGNDNEATGEAALTFDSFVIGESNPHGLQHGSGDSGPPRFVRVEPTLYIWAIWCGKNAPYVRDSELYQGNPPRAQRVLHRFDGTGKPLLRRSNRKERR